MYDFSKLTAYIDSLENIDIPLSAIEVRKENKVICRHFSGFRDREHTVPFDDKSLCAIYSATKVITCIALMRLVEEGKISLDDPVSKYLPEFADVKVQTADGIKKAEKVMTIEHLFTMQGGLGYDIWTKQCSDLRTENKISTREFMKVIAETPLSFEPGTDYQYSFCHDVLAGIAEVVTGKRYGEWLDEVLFKPLDITHITFHLTGEQKKYLSTQYTYNVSKAKASTTNNNLYFCMSDNYDSGGAGLYSNLSDYSKIIGIVANGGVAENGYRVLKPETIKMMQVGRLCEKSLESFMHMPRYGYSWGLCGRVHINPALSLSSSSIGEFGWDGAGAAYVLMDPAEKLSIFFLTYILGAKYIYDMVHPRIRELTYEAIK